MSNQVGDCFKFWSLLRKPELYKEWVKIAIFSFPASPLKVIYVIYGRYLSMTFSVALSGFSEGVLGSFELLKHWLAYSQPQCMRPDHLKKEKRQIQNSEFILWHCPWTTASGQSCSNKIMKIFKTDFFWKTLLIRISQ